jgi:hypothetical protein
MDTRRRRNVVLVLAGLTGLTCADDSDLPAGWHGARQLPVAQSACLGGPDGQAELGLSPGEGGSLAARFSTSLFRCGQRACAYVLEAAPTTKLLVQPCEMNPGMVARCACTSDVMVVLPASSARTRVELWLRPDNYGQTVSNPPVLVDTAPVAPACQGGNPAQRCRISSSDCLPSACGCDAGNWVCTADCGGGRLCPDGGS